MPGDTDDTIGSHETEDGGESYRLVCPFWIDTDAYSDRDRAMFSAGFEFAGLLADIRFHDDAITDRLIHRENESRARMACRRFGRKCSVEPYGLDEDPDGLWSRLTIEPR